MNLNTANKAGLIEPLAAVLFRALAVSSILETFMAMLETLFQVDWNFFASPAMAGTSVTMISWMILLNFLIPLSTLSIPLVLYAFSLRLARMISRSLSRALEPRLAS